jgi:hypothetical protein
LRFSASDSIALSRTWLALSCAVSRLTSQDRRSRPASSDWPSASSTAPTSSRSMRQDIMHLSSQAISTTSKAVSMAPCQSGAAT